jgi:hypothetical protein
MLTLFRESPGMKYCHLRRIPHESTKDFRRVRIQTCRELVASLAAHEKSKCRRFVAGNEIWIIFEFHHLANWSLLRHEVPQKIKQQIGA